MTVHKAQGLTLSRAVMNLGSATRNFSSALIYTALSRVPSLQSLILLDFRSSRLRVDEEIQQEYQRLNSLLPPNPTNHWATTKVVAASTSTSVEPVQPAAWDGAQDLPAAVVESTSDTTTASPSSSASSNTNMNGSPPISQSNSPPATTSALTQDQVTALIRGFLLDYRPPSFRNTSNSCYLNSIAQVLSNIPLIRDRILPALSLNVADGSVGASLWMQLRRAVSSPHAVENLADIQRTLINKHQLGEPTSHQDALEIYNVVYDELSSALRGLLPPDDAELSNTFSQLTQFTVRRIRHHFHEIHGGCRRLTETFEQTSWFICAPMFAQRSASISLQQIFDYPVEKMRHRCDQCGADQTFHRVTTLICNAPPLLQLVLPRNIQTTIQEPLIVPSHTVQFANGEVLYGDQVATEQYFVRASLLYYGNGAHGHYMALVRHPMRFGWFKCSDDNSQFLDDAEAFRLVSHHGVLLFLYKQ
jgi:hypothetical protein